MFLVNFQAEQGLNIHIQLRTSGSSLCEHTTYNAAVLRFPNPHNAIPQQRRRRYVSVGQCKQREGAKVRRPIVPTLGQRPLTGGRHGKSHTVGRTALRFCTFSAALWRRKALGLEGMLTPTKVLYLTCLLAPTFAYQLGGQCSTVCLTTILIVVATALLVAVVCV